MDPQPTAPTPPHTGTLCIMGPEGDVKVCWDVADPATIAAAEAKFNALVGPSVALRVPYAAFRLDSPTDTAGGEQIRTFDPHAAQIILVPPLVGG